MELAQPMVNRNGHVSYGNDENAVVRFHKHFYKNKQSDYIEIMFAGDNKSVTDRPIKESDKQRFPRQWEAYQRGEEFKQEGYPLESWSEVDAGIVREYNLRQIYTVEQLANLNEANLDNLGLGARTLHTKAKAFVEVNKKTANAVKYAALNEQLTKQIEDLRKEVLELRQQVNTKKTKGKK